MTYEDIESIPEGQRLRITFEGTRYRPNATSLDLYLLLDDGDTPTNFTRGELSASTARVEYVGPILNADVFAVRDLLAQRCEGHNTDSAFSFRAGKFDDTVTFKQALELYRAGKLAGVTS